LRACTIIAQNYLAHARVLAESFLRHHPDSSFTVLVIDAAAFSGRPEPFETLLPTQIGLEEREFQRMATIYDVLELATAVKPWLLRRLLADNGGVVAYFDPDIEVFASLDEISVLAEEHSIVLTPHITAAASRESNEFSEDAVLNAGVYNLGFIGVRAGDETQRFLDWWMERVARECLVEPQRGRFVDQRWVDFAPSLFDVAILRDPTYNVAWWNLANRELSWTGERYEVNGKPLRFFHFSGYSPDEPHLLSKHQGPDPPVLLSEQPALARICGEYTEHLLAAGYREAVSQPYGFATLPGGLPLDRRMRRLYRAGLTAAEQGQAREPPSPFDAQEPERFIEWLQEPADPMGLSGKISRYLAAVYGDRPDLQAAFPNLRWLHADDYLEWVRTKGKSEEGIPAEFVPEPTRTPARTAASTLGRMADKLAPNLSRKVARRVVPPLARRLARRRSQAFVAAAPAERPPDLVPGVNVAGYFRAELGVGEAARHLIAGIKHAEIPYSTLTYAATTSRQEHHFEGERSGGPVYDTNIICVNADQILAFVREVGPELLAHRYTIGLWWWEIGHFPEFLHDAFQAVDEVWVGSDFVAEAVAATTSKPVVTLPLGIEPPKVKAMSRAQLGLPDGFVFLFSFDFLSVFERKNPLGLIEAFERAFEPGDGPTLVLKSINGDQTLAAAEKLRLAARRDDILLIDEYLSSEEKNALMATCDAYVSLHRSEGFGLTMAEAMALGKPVIATGYAGNLMFMTDENSYLVPYRLAPIPPGCEPYPAGIEWAEPDVEAAAKLMRYVYEHQDEARAKGERARRDMREQHGPERTAAFLTGRLDEIRSARSAPAPLAPPDERPLERAAEYLATGPRNPLSAQSRVPVGRFARRLLFRVLRPYIVRHAEFDEAVLGSLRELDAGLRDLRRELDAELQHARREDERLSQQDERLSQQLEAASSAAMTALQELVERVGTLESTVSERLGAIDENVSKMMSELHAEPYMSDPSVLRTKDADGREAIGFAGNELPVSAEGLYRGFEEIFRGSEEFIRRRQRSYVELIGDRQPVLDVGCGRGEFLDLLAEANIEAGGIDIDEGMVSYCREKGHEVDLADANSHLELQPDDTYGAIFAGQVIEHMPYEELVRFFGLVERKLAPGGVFVAETVNPHSIAALKAFWVDPTHRNPIFPEVAAALAGLHGFEAALIVFPAGTGELEEDRRTQGEYALVATKQRVGAVTERGSKVDAQRIREGEPLRRRAT
jgi:glycosyltransferase involved in cell wall biosynthesis/2-polyprenyl-3-methyl-5-hydroxy-6-metoxy-1,4-benzoquinol methylase